MQCCLVCYVNENNLSVPFSKFPGLSNLTSLSLKKNAGITAEGMKAFSKLINLVNLDLERCSHIRGGLIHIKGNLILRYSLHACTYSTAMYL